MGIGRMLWRSTGIGRTIDTVRNVMDEGSIIDGIKRTVKEDVCEDNPIGRMIYKTGHYDGEVDGYIEASQEYEEKLLDQAAVFLEQRTYFEDKRDEYEELLNDYEIAINELSNKAELTEKENEYLKKLLLTERELKKLK